MKLELLGKAEVRRKGTWPGTMLKAKQRAASVAMRMRIHAPTTAFPPVISGGRPGATLTTALRFA